MKFRSLFYSFKGFTLGKLYTVECFFFFLHTFLLYCNIGIFLLYCNIFYCIVIYFIVLGSFYCIVTYFIVLKYILLYCNIFYCILSSKIGKMLYKWTNCKLTYWSNTNFFITKYFQMGLKNVEALLLACIIVSTIVVIQYMLVTPGIQIDYFILISQNISRK